MLFYDRLVCNEIVFKEAQTFAKEQCLNTESMSDIALKISELPKENKSRSRVVVITQGKEDVIVAKGDLFCLLNFFACCF